MKWMPALVLLAACAQEPPQAQLAGEPHLSDMTYHCSADGNVVVRFTLEGSVEESITGERCDPDQWRRDEATNGPVYSRPRMNYEQWRAARDRREPEA